MGSEHRETRPPAASPAGVFISYAHDDQAHGERVRQLWLFLQALGVDAQLNVTAAQQGQDWAHSLGILHAEITGHTDSVTAVAAGRAGNLAISLLRLDGHKNIAKANRHHARDPQRGIKLLKLRESDFAVSLPLTP